MFNFFDNIVSFFTFIIDFITNAVEGIVSFFSILSLATVVNSTMVSFIPPVLGAAVIIVALVMTVKLIISILGAFLP